jgi:hypothetical protein
MVKANESSQQMLLQTTATAAKLALENKMRQ